MEQLPGKGETITGRSFRIEFGGKGANQCIAAAELGCKVVMVAKVGADSFGQDYVERFENKSVNIDNVEMIKGVTTGTAMINIDKNGANTIVIISGANERLTTRDIELASDTIRGHRLLVSQLEVPHATCQKALSIARSHQVKTLLNPTPMNSKFNKEMLTFVDYLCLNESEIQHLTGLEVNTIEQGKEACLVLLNESSETNFGLAPYRIQLTMGSQGVVFTDLDYTVNHARGIPTKAIDTTGAGDTFIGAFATLLGSEEMSYSECVHLANEIAALSVSERGAQTLDRFVEFV